MGKVTVIRNHGYKRNTKCHEKCHGKCHDIYDHCGKIQRKVLVFVIYVGKINKLLQDQTVLNFVTIQNKSKEKLNLHKTVYMSSVFLVIFEQISQGTVIQFIHIFQLRAEL